MSDTTTFQYNFGSLDDLLVPRDLFPSVHRQQLSCSGKIFRTMSTQIFLLDFFLLINTFLFGIDNYSQRWYLFPIFCAIYRGCFVQTHSMRPLSEAEIEKESKVRETDSNELTTQNRIKNYIFLERIFIEYAHISHV